MLRLAFRPLAVSDLESIHSLIETDSPQRANSFISDILERCAMLRTSPMLGPARPALGAGIRILPIARAVVVVYLPDEETVTVLRVLYGGRDIGAALNEEA